MFSVARRLSLSFVQSKKQQFGALTRVSVALAVVLLPLSAGAASTLPTSKNLNVSFTSQAPYAVWDEDHNEFCEEASVLMVARFWQGRRIANRDDAERSLQRLKRWQLKRFGYFKDTTAEETATILREYYKLKNVAVIKNPSITAIKREVAAGRPVIVPAAGRLLGNPYFRRPGPLYHMLVIKGYTKDGKFITNDPGTRRGANFLYKPSVIMKAMHDWNGGDVVHGQKVVIVVRGK